MFNIIENISAEHGHLQPPIVKLVDGVGSGKTFALFNLLQNGDKDLVIYSAPTTKLLEEVHKQYSSAFDFPVVTVTDQHVGRHDSVIDVLFNTIKEQTALVQSGIKSKALILTTHHSVLNLLLHIEKTQASNMELSVLKDWELYQDEEGPIVDVQTFRVNEASSLDIYADLLQFNEHEPTTIRPDARKIVNDILNHQATDEYTSTRLFNIVQGTSSDLFDVYASNPAGKTTLSCVRVLKPQLFSLFKSFTIMCACFDQTITHAVWSKQNTPFVADTEIKQWSDQHRITPADKSNRITFYSAMPDGVDASGAKLKQAETFDSVINGIRNLFENERYLLSINDVLKTEKYQPTDALKTMLREDDVEVLPAVVSGLNNWQDYDNIACIRITQPSDDDLRPVALATGLEFVELRRIYRFHSVYQTIGRCSIRNTSSDTDVKVVVPDTMAVEMLVQVFPDASFGGCLDTIVTTGSASPRVRPLDVSPKQWENIRGSIKRTRAKIANGGKPTRSQQEKLDTYGHLI
ncbi:hypothetical protein AB4345_05290 [Vibrio breoganii]